MDLQRPRKGMDDGTMTLIVGFIAPCDEHDEKARREKREKESKNGRQKISIYLVYVALEICIVKRLHPLNL